jgi:hypothetical protein
MKEPRTEGVKDKLFSFYYGEDVMDVRMDGYLQEEECMEGKGRLGC